MPTGTRRCGGTGPTSRAGTGCRSAWSSTCWSGTARSPRELLALIDADPLLGRSRSPARRSTWPPRSSYAARAEGALHLEDVLTRRTRISIETAHRGVESAERAAELMGAVLGWDAATRAREVEHYLARVEAERESQRMPTT